MAVKIVVDSGSDITTTQAAELDVVVLPLKVNFEEEEFLDGKNIDNVRFYEKLIESDTLPKTSQIAPAEYEEVFDECEKSGDEVICFTVSSELSGCYQSAHIAADDRKGIYIVDTSNVAIGERALVEYAVRLRADGLSAEEIVNQVLEKKPKLRILALLDTLEYLKKGGRISSATALAGELLSIKPVVTVNDGKVVMVGKARGSKNGNNQIIKMVEETGGIDFTMPYSVAYSGLSDRLILKYLEDSRKLYENYADSVPIHTIGCAIGTHVGPGAIALAFFSK